MAIVVRAAGPATGAGRAGDPALASAALDGPVRDIGIPLDPFDRAVRGWNGDGGMSWVASGLLATPSGGAVWC